MRHRTQNKKKEDNMQNKKDEGMSAKLCNWYNLLNFRQHFNHGINGATQRCDLTLAVAYTVDRKAKRLVVFLLYTGKLRRINLGCGQSPRS